MPRIVASNWVEDVMSQFGRWAKLSLVLMFFVLIGVVA